jgi:hypothetical protein
VLVAFIARPASPLTVVRGVTPSSASA